MTTINHRFATILNNYFRRNMSEMARVFGVEQSFIRDIISGKTDNPTFDNLSKIVDNSTIPISAEWLLTGKGEVEKNYQQVGNIENSTAIGVNVYGSNNNFPKSNENIEQSIKFYQNLVEKQQQQIEKQLIIIENLSNYGK